MNQSEGSSARSRSKRRMRSCAAAVCLLQLASALSAAEPALVKLAVSEGKDIRFAHLTSKDGLSPGGIRDILQDDQGFLWFNTSGVLNRYDGYQFKSYRRDPAHPNYPAGGFLQSCFQGPLRVSMGQLQRISRSVRSRHGNLDPLPDRPQRSEQCPRAGPAHQPGSGRDRVASHRIPACIGWIRRAERSATTLTIRLIRRV